MVFFEPFQNSSLMGRKQCGIEFLVTKLISLRILFLAESCLNWWYHFRVLSDRHTGGSQNLALVHLIPVVMKQRNLQRNKQAGKSNKEPLFDHPTYLLNRLHSNLDTCKNQQEGQMLLIVIFKKNEKYIFSDNRMLPFLSSSYCLLHSGWDEWFSQRFIPFRNQFRKIICLDKRARTLPKQTLLTNILILELWWPSQALQLRGKTSSHSSVSHTSAGEGNATDVHYLPQKWWNFHVNIRTCLMWLQTVESFKGSNRGK